MEESQPRTCEAARAAGKLCGAEASYWLAIGGGALPLCAACAAWVAPAEDVWPMEFGHPFIPAVGQVVRFREGRCTATERTRQYVVLEVAGLDQGAMARAVVVDLDPFWDGARRCLRPQEMVRLTDIEPMQEGA